MSFTHERSLAGQCTVKAYSYKTIPARIGATGACLPDKRLLNHELPGLERSDGMVARLLGARERRAVGEQEACSDIIVATARQILESAEVLPPALDRIIVSSTPGDFFEPCTASVVQYKLGAKCPAMDVGMSCTGWVAAMDLALRCMATGDQRILVLAGTIVSKGTPFHLPMHRAIFGDGAAGVLLEPGEAGQFLAGGLWTDGQHHDLINMPHASSSHPPKIPGEFRGRFYMGERHAISKVLKANLAQGVQLVLDTAGLSLDDVDVAFVHQPAKPLFNLAVKVTGIPREKVIQNFDRYGNTISAEMPISLHESVMNGRVKRGNTILMITFGAGFTAGVLLYRF